LFFQNMTAPARGRSQKKEIVPMIALAKQPKRKRSRPAWHGSFEKMLPAIVRHAKFAFRYMPPDPREEAVAEVVANCWAAFSRLVERGKQEVASPSALARYAVAQVRDGRRVAGRESPKDAMSQIAQHRKGFGIGQLDHFDRDGGSWREVVVEDRRAGPAEIAACRLDFASWLRLLPRRLRKIALTLANGESTSDAATKFSVTPARISQMRLWLRVHWDVFQNQALAAGQQPIVAA
jgi:hypothetical protein